MTKDDEAIVGFIRGCGYSLFTKETVDKLLRLLDEQAKWLAQVEASRDESIAEAVKLEVQVATMTAERDEQAARVAALEAAGNALLSVLDVARVREEAVDPDAYWPAWRQWQAAIRARAETPSPAGPESVKCPRCGADPGRPCRKASGAWLAPGRSHRARIDTWAPAAIRARAGEAPAGAPKDGKDPRCPSCGFLMCEQFDERPINAVASLAIPNGKYRCWTCNQPAPAAPGESKP